MKRKMILILILFMVVGYASVSTSTTIFSLATLEYNDTDFNIFISKIIDSNKDISSISLSSDLKSFTLNSKGDYQFVIKNRSTEYDAVYYISCDGDAIVNQENETILAGSIESGEVIYDGNEKIICSLNVIPTERVSKVISSFTHLVIFDYNGGYGNTKSMYVMENETFGPLPAATLENHVFDGWYYENEKITESSLVRQTNDLTLTAKWKEIEIPKLLGSSDEYVTAKTISVSNPSNNKYEYFYTKEKIVPDNDTVALGVGSSVTINQSGNYLVYFRKIENGVEGCWSEPAIAKVDADFSIRINEITSKAKDYYLNNSITSLVTINTSTLGVTNGISGNVYIKANGKVAFQGINENKCLVKRFHYDYSEYFNNSDVCNYDIYKNLIKNGYGEYGDNTNFSGFTYNAENNEFFYVANTKYPKLVSDEYIDIDRNKKYNGSYDVKVSKNVVASYTGYASYDYDKNWISQNEVNVYSNTVTTLAKDLNPGDTEIYFSDLSNWRDDTNQWYQRGIIFWGYKDGSGYIWPANTYSRNTYYGKNGKELFENEEIDKVNNKITLLNPWTGPTYQAGAEVSQKSGNWGYSYVVSNSNLTTEYKTAKYHSPFRAGTKYFQLVFLPNHDSSSRDEGSILYIKNAVLEEVD